MVEIKLLKDNSEIVPYNFPTFLVHAKKYWLSYYPNMSIVSHWHADVEFIIILKGRMLYSVDGEDHLLEEGQGIFINSKHLHHGHSLEGSDCQFLCMLFHPSLLYVTEDIRKLYVDTICRNTAIPFLIFIASCGWQNEVLKQLRQIFDICQKEASGFELAVLGHLYSLWLTIFQNTRNIEPTEEYIPDKRLETLYSMIGFIQKNYNQKIILKDIAAAGSVCRSSCCDIFSGILHMTPIQYVTQYRLEKGIEYLNHSDLSITDIAMNCGFNSSSYFTEVFHRSMGCTPSQYILKLRAAVCDK